MRSKSALFAGLLAAAVAGNGYVALAQETANQVFVAFDQTAYSGDLAVEVDGIDMTAFATLVDGGILIEPDVPLTPGPHEVTLYLWTGSSYEVIGVEQINISGSSGDSGGAAYSVTSTHEAGGLSYNGEEAEGIASSTGQLEFRSAGGRLKMGAAWVATSRPEDQIDGQPLNLGEYYLEFSQTGERFDSTTRLGHQILTYDRSLVMDLNRRGVSTAIRSTDGKLEFGAFAVQAQDGAGVDNFLGLDEQDDRMFGGTLSFAPSEQTDLRFGVSTFAGRGTLPESLDVSEGWGVVAFVNGSLADQKLRYRFDLGYSSSDADAELLTYDEVGSTAVLAGLDYDAWTGDNGETLTLGLDYERVEADYYILAAPGLPRGREDVRLRFAYAGEYTFIDGMVQHQITNIGGPATQETDRIITAQLDGTRELFSEGNGPAWMGEAPILEFGAQLTLQDRLETPPMAIPQEDFREVILYAGLAVQHDLWGWSTTYTFTDNDDDSALNDDFRSHELFGSLDWAGNDRWTVNSSATLTWIDDFSGTYLDQEYNLSVGYDIVPGDWSLQTTLAYYDYGLPGIDDGLSLGSDLTWTFAPATEMIFSGGIATGELATETAEDPEWFVGFLLRKNTNFLKGAL